MGEFHTVLFKSRNKDNKHLKGKGFKERAKTFLTDLPEEELLEEFEDFVNKGEKGEVSRFYKSVNSRNVKKANLKMVHHLIDYPELEPHKLATKYVSLASQKDCSNTKKWLIDVDESKIGLSVYKELIKGLGKDFRNIEVYPTVSGYAIVTPRGFDSRGLLGLGYDISIHRDGELLVSHKTKG